MNQLKVVKMNDGVIAKHIFKFKNILIFYENEYYVN